jgi:hypothetical protein
MDEAVAVDEKISVKLTKPAGVPINPIKIAGRALHRR